MTDNWRSHSEVGVVKQRFVQMFSPNDVNYIYNCAYVKCHERSDGRYTRFYTHPLCNVVGGVQTKHANSEINYKCNALPNRREWRFFMLNTKVVLLLYERQPSLVSPSHSFTVRHRH